MLRITAFIPVLILTGGPALAVHPGTKAFVEGLYTTYETNEMGLDISSRSKAARYFTLSTAALIGRDRDRAAKRRDVGRLESDPFVDSQDWAPTKIDVVVEDGPRPDRARARASFTHPGEKTRTTIFLELSKAPAGWRVSEIS